MMQLALGIIALPLISIPAFILPAPIISRHLGPSKSHQQQSCRFSTHPSYIQIPPHVAFESSHQLFHLKHPTTEYQCRGAVRQRWRHTRLQMSILVWPLAAVGVGLVGASIVNALQGGVRGYLGASQEQILGVPAEEATAEDVAKLSKAGFMQLFYASQCPTKGDLEGEYRSRTLEMGVLHPTASILTHRIWGPGRWLGKGIRTGSSEGYNLFSPSRNARDLSSENGGLNNDTLRERCFEFSLSTKSVFDGRASSRLDYGQEGGNGPLFGGMRDEIRKVNSQLFVGLGYIQAFGGKYNSAPFVVEGPPVGIFSGPDRP